MLTYLELLERMEEPSGHLMSSGDDTQAMGVIRAGMHVRSRQDGPSFWDDFLQVMGNPQGVADLLGIKPQQVRTWNARIRELMKQVEETDAQNPEGENEKKVLPTGDNGAIVAGQIQPRFSAG